LKILYVEDTEANTKAAQRMASYLGHHLIVATSGADGYALAHDYPDLILMDINLPDTDGLTLTRKLRAENITVPIVALTGDLMNYDREQALQAGCNDFIAKPFTLEMLRGIFSRYST
jgi:CheY-like chemotaxis protein